MLDDQVKRRAAVLCLADECQLGAIPHERRHALAREALVVDDQRAKRHSGWRSW